MALVRLDPDILAAPIVGPGNAAELERTIDAGCPGIDVGIAQRGRVCIALVGLADFTMRDEVIEESIPAQGHDPGVGQAIENGGHLPDDAGALLSERTIAGVGVIKIEVDDGWLAFPEFREVVEQNRAVGIEQLSGLEDVEPVVFLRQREELAGFGRPVRDLLLEPLDSHLLSKGPHLLHFVGIDGIIDLEMRHLQHANGALGLAEGLAWPATGGGRDDHLVLRFVFLDGDVEGIDAGGLEEPHLPDTRRRILDLTKRIREAHDAEGVLREDVQNGH